MDHDGNLLKNTLLCSCTRPTMRHDDWKLGQVRRAMAQAVGHHRPLRPRTGGRYEPIFYTAVGVRQSTGWDVRARVREWVGEAAACPGAGARLGGSPRLGEGTRVVHRRDAAARRWAAEKSRDPQKSGSRARCQQIGGAACEQERSGLPSICGRCFKGVDPMLNGYPKLVAIDEEAKHQIVHGCGFGKADRATHQTLDPGPQIDMFALDGLCVLFADGMLLGVEIPFVGPPPIRVKPRDTKRL